MAEFTPYMSEIKFLGPGSGDFIEVALDDGADPSVVQVVVYNKNGTVRSTNALDASPDNTIAGTDVYTIEAAIHKMGAVALVVDGVVVSFVSFDTSVTATAGPANGMTAVQLGTTASGESLASTDGGATYAVDTTPDPGIVPCFVAGSPIDTPDGPRAVETLQPGDLVLTVDRGPQPVGWTGVRSLSAFEARRGRLRPVRIPKGAMGNADDILVSPAHRIALADPQLELLFGAPEALAPAHALVGWNGIHIARDVPAPTYCHLMFDRHHLVTCHGLPSESFHPGQLALSGLERATRDELVHLFPALKYRPGAYGPTARRCLKSHEVQVALATLPRAA